MNANPLAHTGSAGLHAAANGADSDSLVDNDTQVSPSRTSVGSAARSDPCDLASAGPDAEGATVATPATSTANTTIRRNMATSSVVVAVRPHRVDQRVHR